jgi:hypothetical protein
MLTIATKKFGCPSQFLAQENKKRDFNDFKAKYRRRGVFRIERCSGCATFNFVA